jgi:hypothetical protein
MRPDEFGAFYVDTVELDGQAELRLVGELDMDTADRPAQALEPVIDVFLVVNFALSGSAPSRKSFERAAEQFDWASALRVSWITDEVWAAISGS